MKLSTQTSNANHTKSIGQKTVQVLSMPSIASLLLSCMSLITTPVIYTIITDLQEHLSKPEIIYVN